LRINEMMDEVEVEDVDEVEICEAAYGEDT
jgi:hypothetical protein